MFVKKSVEPQSRLNIRDNVKLKGARPSFTYNIERAQAVKHREIWVFSELPKSQRSRGDGLYTRIQYPDANRTKGRSDRQVLFFSWKSVVI
jgi:hypothetical protein